MKQSMIYKKIRYTITESYKSHIINKTMY